MSRPAPGTGSRGNGAGSSEAGTGGPGVDGVRFGGSLVGGTQDAEGDDVSLACIELVELVTEYLDETLDASVRQRVDNHLALCPYCVTYVEQIRQVAEASGRLDPEDVPPDVMGRLLTAFREVRAR